MSVLRHEGPRRLKQNILDTAVLIISCNYTNKAKKKKLAKTASFGSEDCLTASYDI